MLGRLEMSKLKFKHQAEAGAYIVDFMIPSRLVIIEVDGSYHDKPEVQAKDVKRQSYLETLGFKVIRVKNEDAASFDLSGVEDTPEATPQELGRVMGKSGAWRTAMHRAKYRRIKERARK